MGIEKPNKIYLAELVEEGGCYPEWRTEPYEAVHKNHEYIRKEAVIELLKGMRKNRINYWREEDMNRATKWTITDIIEKIEEI
jgi:hypothetical protein